MQDKPLFLKTALDKPLSSSISLALYQPDIPQNTGTMLRMAACLGMDVDIIEPAGFPVSDRDFRRSGMDYVDQVLIRRHMSWEAFTDYSEGTNRRLVLLSTKAQQSHVEFTFKNGDVLIVGRESAGVPLSVHEHVMAKIKIPMAKDMRSLNVAISAALVCGEALRQIDAWPKKY